jgi:hypothetical protein
MSSELSGCGIRVAARSGGGTEISLHAKSEWASCDGAWGWVGLAFGAVVFLAWLRVGGTGVFGLCGVGVEV